MHGFPNGFSDTYKISYQAHRQKLIVILVSSTQPGLNSKICIYM